MPASSNTTLSIASSEPVFTGGATRRTLIVRRSAQARRITLAVDPRDGRVRLTVPKRAALAPALAWVETRRGWIEAALARLPVPAPLAPGLSLPLEGSPMLIDWRPDSSRTVTREGGRLIVGGPADLVGGRVLRWLRAEALRVLEAETRALAAAVGLVVGRVRVGDARGRWGSCSSSGDIAYSWRLILAPPAVRQATVAHEVAHLMHMDHGPAFHAAVERLLGRCPNAERTWLKRNGAGLHQVGPKEA